MAVNIRQIYRFAILSLVFTLTTGLYGSVAKAQNVLTIRFDTVTLQPGQSDVFLNVYYTFTTTKPHSFRGYNLHFSYDSTKTRIVDMMAEGTASEFLAFQEFNPHPPEARAVVLGDQEADLTNPVLFRIRLSASHVTDTAWFRWTYLDVPKEFGVDTVIAIDGWVRVAPQKVAVELSAPRLTIGSDSGFTLPVSISDLSKANLKEARLRFTVDDSILEFARASMSGTSNAIATSSQTSNGVVTVDISATGSGATIQGDTNWLLLSFKARKRTDTVCTVLANPTFQALNADALITTSTVHLDTICIQGKAEQPVAGVVGEHEERLEVYPNPFDTRVIVNSSAQNELELILSDMSGREVSRTRGAGGIYWDIPVALTSGTYLLELRDLRTQHTLERRLLVHGRHH